MNYRTLMSNLQYLSLIFIVLSFIFEFKVLVQDIFLLYLVIAIALLILTFAYYSRKKEKGIIISSVILGLFNILGYGVYGVPEHIALKEFINAFLDLIVSLSQLAVVIISLILISKK